jgi:hypothetical protein
MLGCPLQHPEGGGQFGPAQGFDLLAIGEVEEREQPDAGGEPGEVVGVPGSRPVLDGEDLVGCQLDRIEGLAHR